MLYWSNVNRKCTIGNVIFFTIHIKNTISLLAKHKLHLHCTVMQCFCTLLNLFHLTFPRWCFHSEWNIISISLLMIPLVKMNSFLIYQLKKKFLLSCKELTSESLTTLNSWIIFHISVQFLLSSPKLLFYKTYFTWFSLFVAKWVFI